MGLDRGEFLETCTWLDSYYRAPDGLQRPNGLSIHGDPDFEAVAAWIFDVYQNARLVDGLAPQQARERVVYLIRQSAEWQQKHPNDRPNPGTAAPAGVPSFPAESGRLQVQGRIFVQENGQPWQWRGASQFLLPGRLAQGEDVRPTLQQMRGLGVNVIRAWMETPPWSPQYGVRPGVLTEQQQGDFLALAQSEGLRVEATAITVGRSDQQVITSMVQTTIGAASAFGGFHLVEYQNEPDWPSSWLPTGLDRRGVLCSFGYDPARVDYHAWAPILTAEYIGSHDTLRDFVHSPHAGKDLWDIAAVFNKPTVAGEPWGFLNPGYPNYVQIGSDPMGRPMYAHVGGGGARTGNATVYQSMAAGCWMLAAGFTVHPQEGLEGRPFTGPTVDLLASLANIAAFVPPGAAQGVEGHNGGGGAPVGPFGLAWRAEAGIESFIDRANCIALGNHEWVVVEVPAPTWQGWQCINRWRLEQVGPVPFVARLVQ